MSIPSWTPATLRSLWDRRNADAGDLSDVPAELVMLLAQYPNYRIAQVARSELEMRILERIVHDSRMKTVWEKLSARCDDGDPYDGKLFWALRACASDWELEPKESAAEKRKHLEEIFDMAKRLALALCESRHMPTTRVAELMKDSEVISIANEIGGSDGEEESFEEINKDGLKDALNYLREHALEFVPPMEVLLIRLAQLANTAAHVPPIVKQPRSPNAQMHFFVREMSWYFRRNFGSPLHELVATTVSVALDTDVDEEAVRALVRGTVDRTKLDFRNMQDQFFGDWKNDWAIQPPDENKDQ